MDVRVTTWPDGKKPNQEDAIWFDIGVGVVPFLEVEVSDGSWGYAVRAQLSFSLVQGRYHAKSVTVDTSSTLDGDGQAAPKQLEVTSVLLRQVRVAEIVRLGASGGIFSRGPKDERAASQIDRYGPNGEIRLKGDLSDIVRKMGPVDHNLHNVGFSYTLAKISGDPPAKAVERQFDLPPRTAADWIARAKAAGKVRDLSAAGVISWPSRPYLEDPDNRPG